MLLSEIVTLVVGIGCVKLLSSSSLLGSSPSSAAQAFAMCEPAKGASRGAWPLSIHFMKLVRSWSTMRGHELTVIKSRSRDPSTKDLVAFRIDLALQSRRRVAPTATAVPCGRGGTRVLSEENRGRLAVWLASSSSRSSCLRLRMDQTSARCSGVGE